MFPRSSGLLLHVTSLPGGRLGPDAYRFVDFLAEAGQRWWQMLPVGPPGPGRSPYSGLSAFAGGEHLLEPGAREEAVIEDGWLEDYVLYRALREEHGGPWTAWPRPLRDRHAPALRGARRRLGRRVARHERLQRRFEAQWIALKRYANERGIGLVGDLPLFVHHDSADVWAHRPLFELDRSGRPPVVAGVPPDYFSRRGQKWGNPLYRWDALRRRGFGWWIARVRRALEMFDVVRLDHFLGILRAWEVPAAARDARRGRWTKGPGAELLSALDDALGRPRLIAEDLGLVTPESQALRKRFGLPGMQVVQFSFGDETEERPYYIERDCVAYTGTHDNDTVAGWFAQGGPDRERALRYAGCRADRIHWGLIRVAWLTAADVAVAPVQDVLGLGSEARMNTPGTARGNWRWRLEAGALRRRHARALREVTEAAER